MVQRARQVEAKVIRAAQYSVRRRPWSDLYQPPQDILLLPAWNHVEEHPQRIRLLAEGGVAGIVSQQLTPRIPAFFIEPAAHMLRQLVLSCGAVLVSHRSLQLGRVRQRSQVFERS